MQTHKTKIKSIADKYSLYTMLTLSSIYVLVIAIRNFNDPLWYDEAWRADLIKRGLFNLSYAHAPVTAGYYILNKLIDIFSTTNFSQRIINYIALLVLPLVVYIFCKTFFNKTFAKLMIFATFISGYIIENSSVDKPYLLDIIVTLLLIVTYKKFLEGKLKLIYFTLLSLASSLISFVALFILPSLAILLFYSWIKHKKPDLKALIIWSISWMAANLAQLVFFVRPQLKSLLYQHWSGFFLSGSFLEIIKKILSNLGTIFGFSIGPEVHTLFLETSNIFWNIPQFKILIYPVDISGILSSILLATVIYGLYKIYKEHGPEIPLIILIVFTVELVTALLGKWPFGNARSNIFSLFLLYIVLVYGAYSFINYLVHYSKKTKLFGLGLSLSFSILFFPYSPVAHLMNRSSVLSQPADGMESAAYHIAKYSTVNDTVLVSNTPGPLGFQYYFNYASYTNSFRKNEAKHVIYTYNPNDYMIMPNLKSNKAGIMWVVLYRYYTPNVISNDLTVIQHSGYSLADSFTSQDILVDKFSLSR